MQLDAIRERGLARGDAVVDTSRIVDGVIAPCMYHLLFAHRTPSLAELEAGLARAGLPPA